MVKFLLFVCFFLGGGACFCVLSVLIVLLVLSLLMFSSLCSSYYVYACVVAIMDACNVC